MSLADYSEVKPAIQYEAFYVNIIDSFSLYELDYYTQQEAKVIDLENKSLETFITPPKFKFGDMIDLEIEDLDRSVSVEIILNNGTVIDEIEDYMMFTVENNKEQRAI